MIEQNSVVGRRTQGPAIGKSLSISVVMEHTWANLLEREILSSSGERTFIGTVAWQ